MLGLRKRIRTSPRPKFKVSGRGAMQNSGRDFSFLAQQRGMFSYTGLTRDEVEALKTEPTA